jgi:hypothetical protein
MAALDADGLKTAGAIGGAGALVLNGALATTGFDVARRIAFIHAGDDSGDSYVVVGTNRNGDALTETIAGGNATTVVSDNNFLGPVSITASGASAGNVTIGSYTSADTPWYPVDYIEGITVAAIPSTGAGFTYAIQTTNSDVFASGFQDGDAITYEEFSGVAAVNFKIPNACRAVRIAITGWTSASDTLYYQIVVPRAYI